jgi:hypothetical protein
VLRIIKLQRAILIYSKANDYDAFKARLADFQRAVEATRFETRVHYLSHGDSYPFMSPA